MTISSRTPEGSPNQCVLCGHVFRLEPSLDSDDAPCPACGHLLWFQEPGVARLRSYEGFVIGAGKAWLGPFPADLQGALLEAVGLLARQERLPERDDLIHLLSSVESWTDLVGRLQLLGERYTRRHWAYRAGAFLRRRFKWLFARTKAA